MIDTEDELKDRRSQPAPLDDEVAAMMGLSVNLGGRDLYFGPRGTRGVVSRSPSLEGGNEDPFVCRDAPPISGDAGRSALEVVEAIHPSAGSGCEIK